MNKTGATIQTSCVFAAHIAKNTMGMQRMVAMQTQSRGGIGCLQHFDRVVIGPRLRRLTILPMSSAALRALAVAGLNPPTSTNQVQGGFVEILDLGGGNGLEVCKKLVLVHFVVKWGHYEGQTKIQR